MALPSSPNQISLQDILFEKQRTTTARTNVSLKGLSVDGINDYQGVDITGTPNGTAPYKISEFFEWFSILTSGNLTNGYFAGNYSQPGYSGYSAAGTPVGYGSWSGSNFYYDEDTVQLYQLSTIDPPGSTDPRIFLSFYRAGEEQPPFNNRGATQGGWNNLNIYLNQTDNNGSPDLTLARASASWSSNPPMANWVWGPSSSYAISSYFGTTPPKTHHIEIL